MNVAQEREESMFGERYRLTEPLAVGGMAEVFLARQQGQDGFCKELVIKRLRPELSSDPRVVAMFRDEARISGLLGHSNAVHVFDSGTHKGLPFMAMEYIRGEELNNLCRRGIGCGEFLPLEHAVELIRQAALAMGYFHNMRDLGGEPLDLVHCDISPNNLLVGEDGNLQVIDFGISQFRGQQYRDAQLVPGKLSYMSPEQARRDRLDHRSDIFSLGVVLYEITLGRRLFRGPAREVLPRIINCDIEAPTFAMHDYPGALESIVMRALECEPGERFQEAYELAAALGDYLREEKLRTGPVGIARYLDRLAVAEGGERREHFVSEAELEGDDETLDFDRGLFSGFRVMAGQEEQSAASWDEVDEDEVEVANALGIDVELVRTASRTAGVEGDGEQPEDRAREDHSTSKASAGSSDSLALAVGQGDGLELPPLRDLSASEIPSPAQATALSVLSSPSHGSGGGGGGGMAGWSMMIIGVVLGMGGAFLLGAL